MRRAALTALRQSSRGETGDGADPISWRTRGWTGRQDGTGDRCSQQVERGVRTRYHAHTRPRRTRASAGNPHTTPRSPAVAQGEHISSDTKVAKMRKLLVGLIAVSAGFIPLLSANAQTTPPEATATMASIEATQAVLTAASAGGYQNVNQTVLFPNAVTAVLLAAGITAVLVMLLQTGYDFYRKNGEVE